MFKYIAVRCVYQLFLRIFHGLFSLELIINRSNKERVALSHCFVKKDSPSQFGYKSHNIFVNTFVLGT